jgi:uncharacterized protein (DUF362 family)
MVQMSRENSVVSLVHRDSVPGTPGEYDQDSLNVVRGMVKEAIDHVGGIRRFVKPHNKVFVKPNVVGAIPPEFGCTTDPRVLEALCSIILDAVPNISELTIGESCASPGKAKVGFESAGISRICKKLGVKECYFDEVERVSVSVPGGVIKKTVMLPKPLVDADVYVGVPKLKCHPFELVTLCIKNQHGLLSHKEMLGHHRDDGHQKFVDIYRAIRPHLNVVDGIYAMQGTNVSNDRNHIITDMNTVLAGEDGVAVDAVGSAIMGYSPDEIPTTRLASISNLGVGDLRNITVKGASIESVARRFQRPLIFCDGVDPDVRTYIGGACIGCKVTIIQGCVNLHGALEGRATFTPQIKREAFRKLFGHLSIISGVTAPVPEEPDDGLVIVVGNCAKEHKDKGLFLPGCWGAGGEPILDLQIVDNAAGREKIVEGKSISEIGESPYIWDLDNLPLMVLDQMEKKLRQNL